MQVDSSHYNFSDYVRKARWISLYYQINEIIDLKPSKILEIGPGPGIFRTIVSRLNVDVVTIDIDVNLEPNIVASVDSLPFAERCFDVVCAFQVLEHMPYSETLKAYAELSRVSNGSIVISLPDAKPAWRYVAHIPKIGVLDKLINRPFSHEIKHEFDGQHYWEINKRGFSLDRIVEDMSIYFDVIKTYRVKENPYHRMFILKAK